jgi:hypothetical protein
VPGTLAAHPGAVFHAVNLLATLGAGVTHVGADPADLFAKSRTAQHEIGRGLADLGAVHHQPEMAGLDVFAPRLQAMVHRFMQASLMTPIACVNTRLNFGIVSVSHGNFSFRLSRILLFHCFNSSYDQFAIHVFYGEVHPVAFFNVIEHGRILDFKIHGHPRHIQLFQWTVFQSNFSLNIIDSLYLGLSLIAIDSIMVYFVSRFNASGTVIGGYRRGSNTPRQEPQDK